MRKKGTSIPVITLVTEIHDTPTVFRSIRSFCEDLHHVATLCNCLFYVFSINDFKETEVNGFYFEDNLWKKKTLPLPHVIYNRIHSRKLENSQDFHLWKKQISQLGIPIFNDRFLSKWEVHELISVNNQINPHLPETYLYSKNHLEKMITIHPLVFLKPVNGSQGRNIIRITRTSNGFSVDISNQTEAIISFDTLTKLLMFIDRQLANRPYIIQQGVELLTFENRSLDFRVLCHLNFKEIWKITSIVARVAADKQFVSNLSKGGDIIKPLAALSSSFDQDTSLKLLLQIKELAIDISTFINNRIDGIFGEFGIDIGLDRHEKIWLIEVNSKPSKNFDHPSLSGIRPSAKAIINYCVLLAKNQN